MARREDLRPMKESPHSCSKSTLERKTNHTKAASLYPSQPASACHVLFVPRPLAQRGIESHEEVTVTTRATMS